MQYFSPFKLLGIDINNTTEINPGLLKKKMLAEFELSNAVTINTPSGEFSKQDILDILEQLKDAQVLAYHREIARDTNLLDFLETAVFTGSFTNNSLYNNENFLLFISPYFANAYCKTVCNLFDALNTSNNKISNIPVLIHQRLIIELLKPINKKIAGLTQEISIFSNEIKNKKNFIIDAKTEQLFGFHIIKILNQLNFNFFEADIELYARECIGVINNCVNEKQNCFNNSSFVHYLLTRLNTLETNSETKNVIDKYFSFYKQVAKIERKKDGPGVGKMIYLILVIVVALIRVGSTCSSSHHFNTHPYSSLNVQNSNYNVTYSDSETYKQIYFDLIFSLRLNKRQLKNENTAKVMLKTGDNPISNLTPISTDTSANQYKLKIKNQSNWEVVALINTTKGNIYTFINPKNQILLGIPTDCINLAFLVGKDWDINYSVDRVRTSKNEGRIKYFTGGFDRMPDNINQISKVYNVLTNVYRGNFSNIVIPEFKILEISGNVVIENNLSSTTTKKTELPDKSDSVSKKPLYR